ncbi:hypothetical protein [Pseudoduganella namucuonensis]|uniref:Exonuclease SbcC n=1 Tax=Pseudoduganella namucuonensis TaxID=1035707 RepID=A0A1I7M7B1_9BURK|nr:hypothetical protein [Pseudoduganella namucuonensis]SFV17821.1 exonuclease SbcC [Pseudoduganella namucuonensis]
MIPLKLTLTGFNGIRDGMGRESLVIDFERETGGAMLVALTGGNGRGKSTLLDNMTPYPVMPSRAGADGLGAFSYYDEVYLPENHKELEWRMGDTRYRSQIVIRVGGKRRTEAYLHEFGEKSWTPARLGDGTVSDGRMETYGRLVEGIAGPAATFFSTAFSAQQRRQLSAYRNGEIKSLLADLLRLDAVRERGERANEVLRLLRCGQRAARTQCEAQRQAVHALRHELAEMGDTTAQSELARQNRNVAAARLDARRNTLAALRAEADVAAGQEARRVQLLAERGTALTGWRQTIEELDNAIGGEEAARDDMAQRHAQRAASRETGLASLRAQRTTLLASREQERRAALAAAHVPLFQHLAGRRASVVSELRQSLARKEKLAADLALAQARQMAVEREAGQAALKAQELRRRLSLTREVPCSGMPMQTGCKLLGDAHAAHALLPDAGAVVARLNAAYTAIVDEINGLRAGASGIASMCAALARAEQRQQCTARRLAHAERQAARREALALAAPLLTEVEDRLATAADHSAAERAADDHEYQAQERRLSELVRRREEAARPCAAVARLDAQLASLPPPPDLGAIGRAAQECEQAQAQLRTAEQAQLAALRARDHAEELRRQIAVKEQDCGRRERGLARLDEQMEMWSLLAKALGNDGIIALAIDDAGPELSALANQLLLACYGPRFTVSIKTQVATAKGELREGFDITVHDAQRDTVKSVTRMSGGERIWINECLTRAMALYLAQADGRRSATLFSDEADGAFDAQHKRRFMEMKREVLRVGGYAREFFISHTPELAEMADRVIDLDQYAT